MRLGAARLGPSREAGKQRHGLEGGGYWPLSVPTDKVVAVKSQAPRAPGCRGDQASLLAEGGRVSLSNGGERRR